MRELWVPGGHPELEDVLNEALRTYLGVYVYHPVTVVEKSRCLDFGITKVKTRDVRSVRLNAVRSFVEALI